MSFILHGIKKGACTVGKGALFMWHWSLPYKSSNRPIDPVYRDVWRTPTDEASIRGILSSVLPAFPADDLPVEEEAIRQLVRDHFPPQFLSLAPSENSDNGQNDLEDKFKLAEREEKQRKLLSMPEESWKHVPSEVRNLLATLNAQHMEEKLELLSQEPYHPKAGFKSINRARHGASKTFHLWRLGWTDGTTRKERMVAEMFILFCVFMACFPDVAAGFLGERSYNQRSIGSRVVTLSQLFSLWRYEFHTFWLLFNWSLERLFGALLGNTIYAFTALIPALRAVYPSEWFRFMVLGLSMTWQLGVQFTPALRDYVVRIITRRQMRALRRQGDTEQICWTKVDAQIQAELVPHKAFAAQRSATQPPSWTDVPLRARVERYILFTATYSVGRPADQLIGLLKENLECALNAYEDYEKSAGDDSKRTDKGYAEPRGPKFILVGFDIAIFVYICYSFWPQKFTFNTVTCYGTVVCIKQAIMACRRYQTAKGARRLFTNMVSINILGVFLVSTPVTVNRNVLADNGRFAGLTLAMVFAAIFLSEPIAPLVLWVVEGSASLWSRLTTRRKDSCRAEAVTTTSVDGEKPASQPTADNEKQSNKITTTTRP